MATAATLERPAIEDTLFGDGQVQMIDDEGSGPDANCFCICSCRDSSTKVTGSQYNGLVAAVGK